MSRLTIAGVAATLAVLSGCIDKDTARQAVAAIQSGPPRPDVLPVILNKPLPFHYPAALYDKRVQGNVTLRIFIDSLGSIRPESTLVVESSGYPPLDSAAIEGSRELRFVPAKLQGRPMAVPILFPVYFRHPEAQALPGDTILKSRGEAKGVGGEKP
jgi:TonB family protein